MGAFEISGSLQGAYDQPDTQAFKAYKEQEHLLSRDKDEFIRFSSRLTTDGGPGMIKMDTAEGTRWIKITCKTAVHPIRCVGRMTDEILETKALKVERDRTVSRCWKQVGL